MLDPESVSGSGGAGAQHPRLDSALQTLPAEVRRLWSESTARQEVLQAILDAAESGSEPAVAAALAVVDNAVVEALQALRYPRKLAVELGIEPTGPRGRLTPDGKLRIGPVWIRQDLNVARNPDTAFRVWVQESIHARQPFAPGWEREYAPYPGYEEGLAEGLALAITRDRAGMQPQASKSYAGYVRAYELLAQALESAPEALYRRVWTSPAGLVRGNFARVVSALYRKEVGRGLTKVGREALLRAADEMFGRPRMGAAAEDTAILAVWKQALP